MALSDTEIQKKSRQGKKKKQKRNRTGEVLGPIKTCSAKTCRGHCHDIFRAILQKGISCSGYICKPEPCTDITAGTSNPVYLGDIWKHDAKPPPSMILIWYKWEYDTTVHILHYLLHSQARVLQRGRVWHHIFCMSLRYVQGPYLQ